VKKAVMFLVFLLLFTTSISAQDLEVYSISHTLLTVCEEVGNPACEGYIVGVYDASQGVTYNGQKYCIPSSVKAEQLVRVVKKYLQDHPEFLHLASAHNVYSSFKEAFPCE